jgi:hypothetical protein
VKHVNGKARRARNKRSGPRETATDIGFEKKKNNLALTSQKYPCKEGLIAQGYFK